MPRVANSPAGLELVVVEYTGKLTPREPVDPEVLKSLGRLQLNMPGVILERLQWFQYLAILLIWDFPNGSLVGHELFGETIADYRDRTFYATGGKIIGHYHILTTFGNKGQERVAWLFQPEPNVARTFLAKNPL